MSDFGTKTDLVARLTHSLTSENGKPIAVLCGAGLTQPVVPGAAAIIHILRKSLESDDRGALDERLQSFELDAEKYQAAFQFLRFRRPTEFREQVVRAATLGACLTPTDHRLEPSELGTRESDVDKWKLTNAVAALGRIWAGLPANKRGPILTTNFDPLIEISVRKAGGSATTYIQVDDSSFISNLRVQTGTSVVHLHGYWRESKTLHTPEQLTIDRPAVGAALRTILEENTLLVLGYGAWTDVFTKQLLEQVQNRGTQSMDILWCMFGKGAELRRQIDRNDTLSAFVNSGLVDVYEDIDANIALPDLESRIARILDYPDSTRSSRTVQSVVGWTTLSTESLRIEPMEDSKETALGFFEGRMPTWLDISNPYIPVRDAVNTVTNHLAALLRTKQSSMHLVIGPSGEGKSTLLRQVAYKTLTRDSSISLLLLEGEQIGSLDALTALPPEKQHVLIIDNADDHLAQLEALTAMIHDQGLKGLHIIAAARDTDWRRRGGFTYNWNKHLTYKTHSLNGITHLDAESIVSAWESIGANALRDLASLGSHEERVEALLYASRQGVPASRGFADSGSLLGCFLQVRYGDGLVEHVRTLMARLSDRFFTTSDGAEISLLSALVAIAIPHANNVYSLNFTTLAAYLRTEIPTLISNVLTPLGEEAAVSYSSSRATIRHSAIARAVCDLAADFGIDLAEICRGLVQAAARLLSIGSYEQEVVDIAYLSRKLQTHPSLRVPSAIAAVDATPSRLSYRTTLSAALRDAGLPGDAIQVSRDTVDRFTTVEDPEGMRGFLTEWGVAEGSAGNYAANAFLAGISLADFAWLERLHPDSMQLSLSCLTYGLRRLYERKPSATLFNGLQACVRFSDEVGESKTEYLRPVLELLKKSSSLEASFLLSIDEAAALLETAVNSAGRMIETPLPASFPGSDRVTFKTLTGLVLRRNESLFGGTGFAW